MSEEVSIMNVGPMVFTDGNTGIIFPEAMTYEEWSSYGESYTAIATHSMFWLGDWVNFGEDRFCDKYTQAMECTNLAYQTIKNAAYVARKIPAHCRYTDRGVSFSHHKLLTALDEDAQIMWLEKVLAEEWSVSELKAALAGAADPVEEAAPRTETDYRGSLMLIRREMDKFKLSAVPKQEEIFAVMKMVDSVKKILKLCGE